MRRPGFFFKLVGRYSVEPCFFLAGWFPVNTGCGNAWGLEVVVFPFRLRVMLFRVEVGPGSPEQRSRNRMRDRGTTEYPKHTERGGHEFRLIATCSIFRVFSVFRRGLAKNLLKKTRFRLTVVRISRIPVKRHLVEEYYRWFR